MILVTGGTGLLGSNLLFELSENDSPLKAMYRSPQKLKKLEALFLLLDPLKGKSRFDRIEFVKGDILDVVFLEDAFKGVKTVFHCAALVSFRKRDFYQLMKVNGKGTANVVNACLSEKVEKLIHVSSTAAIGKVYKNQISYVLESNKWSTTNDLSGYAISKYTAEKEIFRGMEEGLNVSVINPSVMFGAGSWDESSMTIFRTLAGGLQFYTKGANAFVDVRDVVKALILLKDSAINGQRFLCTGTNISFKSLFELIAPKLNVKAPSIFATNFLCQIAWRLSALSIFWGKKPTLTKESVQSSQAKVEYDSSKLQKAFSFEYIKLADTIDFAIKYRLK
jgi:nucleoside-diphosphate-sugar epimerase